MELQLLEVGKPYPGRITAQEASWLEYTESGPMLLMAVNQPTAKEIKAVEGGRVELGLYETDPILWFLYKIRGFGPWSDCPFSIRLYDGRGVKFDWSDGIGDGMGLGLQIILIETGTNIVKVLRLVALPTEFSREFRAMILRQLEQPFDAGNYNREIEKVYARLSSDDLAARADVKSRIG